MMAYTVFPIKWAYLTQSLDKYFDFQNFRCPNDYILLHFWLAAAAAKSLQSCLTLRDPMDYSPPGSPIPGILQARTLEWVAISFSMHGSEKWKWSRSVVSDSLRPHGLQHTRLLHPWDFPGKSTGVGCHCLVHIWMHSEYLLRGKDSCSKNVNIVTTSESFYSLFSHSTNSWCVPGTEGRKKTKPDPDLHQAHRLLGREKLPRTHVGAGPHAEWGQEEPVPPATLGKTS